MQIALDELQPRISPEWRSIYPWHKLPQDQHTVFLGLSGLTNDDPVRCYMTFIRVASSLLEQAAKGHRINSLVHTYIHELLIELNTFLDKRCECQPGPDGQLGPKCPWHESMWPS